MEEGDEPPSQDAIPIVIDQDPVADATSHAQSLLSWTQGEMDSLQQICDDNTSICDSDQFYETVKRQLLAAGICKDPSQVQTCAHVQYMYISPSSCMRVVFSGRFFIVGNRVQV